MNPSKIIISGNS